MFGINDLPTYLIGAMVIVLLPGPNSMYCLTVSVQYGVRTAYRSVAGILLGDSILILATVFGAGALLKALPELFHIIKLVGGLYLAFMGWHLLRDAVRKWSFKHLIEQPAPKTAKPLPKHIFKRALLLSLTNPKAILFFLSFFVQFVGPTYAYPMLSFFVLALILQIISFSYLNILMFSGNKLATWFREKYRMAAISMGLVGCLFIGFAVKLWLAQLE